MEDPFLLDQNRIESQLEQLRPQLQRWRQLRDCERQGVDPVDWDELLEEYNCLTNEITTSIRAIGWDVDDLQETLGLMVKAKSPVVSAAGDRDSRAAFLAKVRGFIDEAAAEVAMAGNRQAAEPCDEVIDLTAEEHEHHAADSRKSAAAAASAQQQVPLLSWRKDTDSSSVSFPTVELNSLRDLTSNRFHNRDWTGLIYRYRYLLAMAAVILMIVFFTVVALAAKHTAASAAAAAAAAEAAAASTVRPAPGSTCAPGWTHWWCFI